MRPVSHLYRLDCGSRPPVRLHVDGKPVEAREGDTVLTALLSAIGAIRAGEFGDGPRGGFCCMGACQDCWVTLSDGHRLRACTTLVVSGMEITTGLAGNE